MTLEAFYEAKTCVVTGGASFIGSHLVDALLGFGASVTVLDDFSSGRREHLRAHEGNARLKVRTCDLSQRSAAHESLSAADVVFHLAAIHGGRGFIEKFPSKMLVNLAIDESVFSAAAAAGVGTVVHASSACAYPVALQDSADDRGLLQEGSAGFDIPEQSFPDGTYGWLKLMGEYQVKVAAEAGDFRGRSARIFTAYGERENESHAAIALIAKALLHLDPFPIWGDGLQTRNFTYVQDTVRGLLLLGSDTSSAAYDVFNIGGSTHHTILEFIDVVFDVLGWRPDAIDRQLDLPTGVASRAADNAKIIGAFGWEPQTDLRTGIERTAEWYRAESARVRTADDLERRLMAR